MLLLQILIIVLIDPNLGRVWDALRENAGRADPHRQIR